MKTRILLIFTLCTLLFSGCELDNYDAPKSTLRGKVMFDGEAVGVRSNGVKLSLWQDGFDFKSEIPVYVAQDGTYSVSLFDGEYQMTRKGGSPWEEQRGDTLVVRVKGNTIYDVPVNAYFAVKDATYSVAADQVTAKFTIKKGVTAAQLSAVKLYLNRGTLVDDKKNDLAVSVPVASVVIGSQVTVTATVPKSLIDNGYMYARVGALSTSSSEYSYSQSTKVALK